MTTERDAARIVRSWLEDGATTLPDRVLDQVLDQLPATPQRRPMWRARRIASMNNLAKLAVAAAVVAAAVVGLTLRPSIAPDPGASTEPTSSPTPSPMASPRVVPESGALAPGSWSFMDVAPFPITFTIPAAGWVKNVVPGVIWTDDSEARLGLGLFTDDLYADPCNWEAGTIEPPVGPAVDDLASAIAELPGVEATAPTSVTVDGHQGRFVELTAPTDQRACDGGGMRLAGEGPLEPGRHRFWIVDVDGTRVVISAVDRTAATNRQRDALQEIIDSIRFE